VTTDNRCNRLVTDVWEEVKDLRRGVLYKTIFILDSENAEDICQSFGIREYAHLNEDIQTLDRIEIFQDVLNAFDPLQMRSRFNIHELLKKSMGNLIDINALSVKIIIGIGLIAIALYLLGNYQQKKPIRRTSSPSTIIDEIKGDAVLCLVVPTNRIDPEFRNSLLPDVELTTEETKLLIDKSVYFITCADRDLDNYIGGLNLSQSRINYTEDGEIYIQLFLLEGEETIGKEIKRSLSNKLPDSAIVQGVYLLNDLSNIDRFHRA
jgi:hypothetical protein